MRHGSNEVPLRPLAIRDDSRPVSSLIQFFPRLHSAAPMHREMATTNDKTRSISNSSMRKNEEMYERHEKILLMTRAQTSVETTAIESSFAKMTFANFKVAQAKSKNNEKRKTLLDRMAEVAPKEASYISEKLKTLRANELKLQEFFRVQRDEISERMHEARVSGGDCRAKLELELRDLTPRRYLDRIVEQCADRDAKILQAKENKARILAEKKQHNLAQVDRVRSIGFQTHDTCEEVQDSSIACYKGWITLIILRRVAAAFNQCLKDGLEIQERAPIVHRRSFYNMPLNVGQVFVILIQAWWKGQRFRRLLKRRKEMINIVCVYLRALPRIQVQFRLLSKIMKKRVVLMQLHYRSVRAARMLRRMAGVSLLNKRIRVTVSRWDEELTKLIKVKKNAESRLSAAIKARKPAIESEVKEISKQILNLSKQKQKLLALKDTSKFSEVSRYIYENESVYRDVLRDYGLYLANNYFISENISKVLKEKIDEYHQNMRRKSISELGKVPTAQSIKAQNQSEGKFMQKPIMCVGLRGEDVTEMLQTSLLEQAAKDLEDQMTQNYGGGSSVRSSSSSTPTKSARK